MSTAAASGWSEFDAPGPFGKIIFRTGGGACVRTASLRPHLAAYEGGEVTGNDESAFMVDRAAPEISPGLDYFRYLAPPPER